MQQHNNTKLPVYICFIQLPHTIVLNHLPGWSSVTTESFLTFTDRRFLMWTLDWETFTRWSSFRNAAFISDIQMFLLRASQVWLYFAILHVNCELEMHRFWPADSDVLLRFIINKQPNIFGTLMENYCSISSSISISCSSGVDCLLIINWLLNHFY